MIWQSQENQGIALLDEPMAEQLSSYLEQKEQQLSVRIVNALHLPNTPALEASLQTIFRLSSGVEEFGKKVHRVSESKQELRKNDWEEVAQQINQALWNYVEILEGCVIELYQQIDQISFEQWNIDLSSAVTSIKDELTHRLDDLMWACRRLDQQLKKYRQICEGKRKDWTTLVHPWSGLIDKSIGKMARKCQKFLNFRYGQFIERYAGFLLLYEGAEQSLRKLKGFRVLSSLEIDLQDRFKHIFMLLKIWELNHSSKTLPQEEPIKAMRNIVSPDGVVALFQEYLNAIRTAIFNKSRMIKKEFRLAFSNRGARQPIIENLDSYREELYQLHSVIDLYRDFFSHTDPQCKKRDRLLNWLRKKAELKPLTGMRHQTNEINYLKTLSLRFSHSLEDDKTLEPRLTPQIENEIAQHLHEMSQPLASEALMHHQGKSLLHSLEHLDELSAFCTEVPDFICSTLCKALCADWKYHTLQRMALFHEVYDIHQGIVTLDDRSHINRLNKFRRILEKMSRWIAYGDTYKHINEMELDKNDLKAYLQDFLAYVQRLELAKSANELKKEDLINTYQALLEYLNLFASFFNSLKTDDIEQRLIRKQFLFVDQYFKSIEGRLRELKESH